jgi:hypothetical protein
MEQPENVVGKKTLRSGFKCCWRHWFAQHRIAIAVEHFTCEWRRTSKLRDKIADAVDKRYSATRFGGLTQTINE